MNTIRLLFRQLFDPPSSTWTYLLADPATRDAVLIDPVFEQHARDAALIRELGLTLRATVDTHCHADHVTGAWLMKDAFGSAIGMAAVYGAEGVDRPLGDGDLLTFGHRTLRVRATPGHTDGCLSFVLDDASMVFTGDALLIRGAGRTDFQAGDAAQLYRSIRERLFSLPDDCAVYPGHDYAGRTSSTIGEEKTHNTRIGGEAREEDFVGYMESMALPHPRRIDIAVPANMRAGKPEEGAGPKVPPWGPVQRSYAGVPEIGPRWVADHRAELLIVDVRSADEFDGPLGHIEGARSIPLDELRERTGEVPDGKPLVVICQSGRRSAMGAAIFEKAGFERVANVTGGMLRWRGLGLPIAS